MTDQQTGSISIQAELDTIKTLNRSLEAYVRLLEGALLAAWEAGRAGRQLLYDADEGELDPNQLEARAAWQVAGEVVLRLPIERASEPSG